MRRFGISLVLVLMTWAVLYPVLGAEFLNWDDELYLLHNDAIHELTWASVAVIFFGAHEALYKPLTLLSFAIEHHFFGLNPFVYHLTNLILHTMNVLLIYAVTRRLFPEFKLTAFLTAVFFAIHPMRLESVAWVTERKDVLYVFFYLIALWLYLKHRDRPARGIHAASLVCFVLSALAKPAAFTLPVVLILIEWHRGARIRDALRLTWIYGVIGVFFAALTLGIHAYFLRDMPGVDDYSVWERLGLASYAVFFYLVKFLAPVNLSIVYDVAITHIQWWCPFGLAVVGFVWIGRRYKGNPYYFGAVFFLLTLAPMLYSAYMTPVADRFTYLPYWGLFFITAHALSRLYRRSARARFFSLAAVIAIVMTWSVLAHARTYVFQNSVALWTDCLRQFPGFAKAYNNRGLAYSLRGDHDKAIADYERALALNPTFDAALYNQGVERTLMGEPAEALRFINKAISVAPSRDVAEGYFGRGNAFHAQGMYEEAIADYTRALIIQPDYPDVLFNRANDYKALGKTQLALEDYGEAIRLKPRYVEAYNNRGVLRYESGDLQGAIDDYTQALRLRKHYAEALNNRGSAYQAMGLHDEAMRDFNAAIGLRGDYSEAYNNRGITRMWMGDAPGALEDFSAALRHKPDYAQAYYNRGNVLAGFGQFAQAAEDFDKAAQLQPDLTQAARKRDELRRRLVPDAPGAKVLRRQ